VADGLVTTCCPTPSRHPDRHHPGDLARHRRDRPLVVVGAATFITFDPDGPFSKFTPYRSRSTSGLPAPGRVSQYRCRSHLRAAGDAAEPERFRRPAAQPLQQEQLRGNPYKIQYHHQKPDARKSCHRGRDLEVSITDFRAVKGRQPADRAARRSPPSSAPRAAAKARAAGISTA
jgi:hypothetical protein